MPYGSDEQSSPGLLVTSTRGEEVPQTYSPDFALVNHSSPFELNNFPTSTTDIPASLGQAYANEHITSFDETGFTSQYPPYGSQEALYPPPLSNFATGSPASPSVSPQTLSGAFSPQQNSLNYAGLHHVNNNSTFNESTLGTQFDSMMNINNDRTQDLGMSLAVNSHTSPRLATSMTQHGNSMMALNTTAPVGDIGNPVSSSNLALQNSINTQISPVSQQWGSPTGISSPGAHSHNSRMVSPTVRIEYCSRDDSPRRSRLERNPSHGNKRSQRHLSPYPDGYSEGDNGHTGSQRSLRPPGGSTLPSAQRNEDGSWMGNPKSGLAGIAPDARNMFAGGMVLTLDELAAQRYLAEKNADVEEWLTNSEVGSEAGDAEPPRRGSRGRKYSRPRAKSASDAAAANPGLGLKVPSTQSSSIPGPGLYINVPSDTDEEGYSEASSEPQSPPASITSVGRPEYFLLDESGSSSYSRPWADPEAINELKTADIRDQPLTANAAIMRFTQRAKEIDTASLAATVGSRRRSESDLGSVVHAAGISERISGVHDVNRGRRGTLFTSIGERILPHRGNSGKNKRKGIQLLQDEQGKQEPRRHSEHIGEHHNSSTPKRIGSFGRSRSPRLDTNLPVSGHELRSPNTVAARASGVVAHAKDMLRRSRSRSDLAKSPGLADLWTQHGGPPVPTLASPVSANTNKALTHTGLDDESGDEEVDGTDGIVMDLSVRADMIVCPTYDGFKYQIQDLNRRLEHYLLERLSQEQVKRYKRLVELKAKHSQNVAAHNCPSKTFCIALGGESKALPPRPGTRDPEATLVGFQIMTPGMTEEELERTTDGQVVAAQFPSGVPIPPVKRLPAEFECPLCFKVKKFYKPSDWTKHVHEDVQPFTCTFPSCNEPKSFKRKADWVRHENERHRQLERWKCDIGECTHTCFRKDNFVQHLVREHKVPEPKVRTGRSGSTRSPVTPLATSQIWPGLSATGEATDEDVWALVERCRKDAAKSPKDEPCKFCGNICNSWKKLTVHLAKHMEQISMPVLPLIDQKQGVPETAATAAYPTITQQTPQVSILSTMPAEDLPAGILCAEPAEIDMDGRPDLAINGVTSQMMSTYPPPSLNGFEIHTTDVPAGYGSTSAPFVGQSYPPLMVPSRPRSASFNDAASQLTMSRQGTTYPPPTLPSRNLSNTSLSGEGFLSPQNAFTGSTASGWNNVYFTPSDGTTENMGFTTDGQSRNFSGSETQMGFSYSN